MSCRPALLTELGRLRPALAECLELGAACAADGRRGGEVLLGERALVELVYVGPPPAALPDEPLGLDGAERRPVVRRPADAE